MRASRGEIKIQEILQEAGLRFTMEQSFEGLNSPNGRALRFDFAYLTMKAMLISWLNIKGKQHYEPSAKFGGKKGFLPIAI